MTTAEIREKVDNAPNKNELENKTFVFQNDSVKLNIKLIGIIKLFDFVTEQLIGWETLGEDLPKEIIDIKKKITSIKDMTLALFEAPKYYREFASQRDDLNKIESKIDNFNNYFMTFDLPEVSFLIQLHQKSPQFVSGAFHFINEAYTSESLENKNFFNGVLLANNYISKNPNINVIDLNDDYSVVKIRERFTNYITESENKLQAYYAKFEEEKKERIATLAELAKKIEKDNATFSNKIKQEFETFQSASKTNVTELEKAYDAILTLKKPAEYWRSRAEKLKAEGWTALYWLAGIVAAACISLFILLCMTPEGLLLNFFEDKIRAIKWSIVYITFISFLAYGIRAVSKVMFSSFHLSRDAEEREHLTFVYLSMIKDASVDEKDRHLIMQSLFSRADTGLLKEDSAPTMPGGIDKFIKS